MKRKNTSVYTKVKLGNGVTFFAEVTGVGDVTLDKRGDYNTVIWVRANIEITYIYTKSFKKLKDAEKYRQYLIDTLNTYPDVIEIETNSNFEDRIASDNPELIRQEVVVDISDEVKKAYQKGYTAGRKKGKKDIIKDIHTLIGDD